MTEPTMEPTIPDLMMPEPETKPRRGRPPKSQNGINPSLDTGSSAGSGETPKQGPRLEQRIKEIEIGLTGLFVASGKLVGYWDQFDGSILDGSNPMSTMPLFVDAVCRAARTDAKLRGWLLTIVHVSAYSDIAMFAAMMLMPILLHHNIIPSSFFTSGLSDDNRAN